MYIIVRITNQINNTVISLRQALIIDFVETLDGISHEMPLFCCKLYKECQSTWGIKHHKELFLFANVSNSYTSSIYTHIYKLIQTYM